MKVPYRLKAPTREDIESQIPFDLSVGANKKFSYHFIGHEWDVAPEYNEDGELTNDPVLSDHVLADLRIYDGTEIDFGSEVEVLTDIETPMHGWK